MDLQKLIVFCETQYGTEFCRVNGAINILYLEGCTASDISKNQDAPDQWNDTCLVIKFKDGVPFIAHKSEATSEPGLSATLSARAKILKGVARISIGFHKEKWIEGYHKGNKNHPALVQCAPIECYRDLNKDGKRTGDMLTTDVKGLNQHGTRKNLAPSRVGEFSYSCLVRRLWDDHMAFMRLVYSDPRRGPYKKFKFSATVVDYSKYN